MFLFEHLGECAKREAGISGKTLAEKRITTEQEIDNYEAATLVLPKIGGGTKTNVEDEELETMVLPKIGAGGTKKKEKKNLVPPQSITEEVVENLPDGNICIYYYVDIFFSPEIFDIKRLVFGDYLLQKFVLGRLIFHNMALNGE